MAIVQKSAPPTAGAGIVGNALTDLWGSQRGPLGGAAEKLVISQPLPVYTLSLDEMWANKSISDATHVGWRYLINRAGNDSFADLRVTSDGHHLFSSVAENIDAQRLNQAAFLAEQSAHGSDEYDIRLLDIPALYMSAVWLFGKKSIFIPYIDANKFHDPDTRVLQDDHFVVRMRERAISTFIRLRHIQTKHDANSSGQAN